MPAASPASPDVLSASRLTSPTTRSATYADPEWLALLTCYRNGQAALNAEEAPVPKPAGLHFEGEREGVREDLKKGSLRWAQEMYRTRGYFPAVESPHEQQRQQTIYRYGLHKAKKVQAIDALCELARNVFDVPVCVLNLVLDDKIVFLSSSGWTESERDPDVPPAVFDLGSAMCSHAMSKAASAGCWVIPDTTKDWRFESGPYCQNGKGPVQFFASANVNLPAVVPSGKLAQLLPVGSFCLIDSKPRQLPEKQQEVLKQFARMAAKEIELVFHTEKGTLGELRTDFLGELFRTLLVYPSRVLSSSFEERCSIDGHARSLLLHSRADFAYILDLRNFNFDYSLVPPASPRSPPSSDSSSLPNRPQLPRRPTQESRRSFGSRHDPDMYGSGSIGILDCWCAESEANGGELGVEKEEWQNMLNSPGGLEAISRALAAYHHTNERTGYASPEVWETPLSAILPPKTSSYIARPIFDNEGEPALLVVVGSRERHFVFDDSDERFVTTVGGILMAAILQEKILAADEAKLAFVGSISHELRTPIFAIAGNLQLVREHTSPEALKKIEPLLDVASCCLDTLKDILDDCLEYSKLSDQRRQIPSVETVKSEFTRCNVVGLVTDVIKACWSKEKRYAEMMDRKDEGEGVAIILESHIPPEMEAMIDVGGLKRVGVNLFGNALKFTARGSVTIRLSDATPPASSSSSSASSSSSGSGNLRYLRFEAIDSGVGMSGDFLRNSLFTPFKQADSFAAGAGLGVSLSAQMVERMGGKISFSSQVGVGTTAMVVVPAEILPCTSNTPLPFVHNFTDEFNEIASRRSKAKPHGVATPLRPRLSKKRTTAAYASGTSSTSGSSRQNSATSSFSRRNSTDARKDKKGNEELASGAVETLGNVTADVKTDAKAVPELDGPLEDNAGGDQVRILVVDDNTIARRILCAFLKSKNITFAEASGGAEAIELFKSFGPNLVWCDIQMPDVDGIQATREMRRYEEKQNLEPARIVAVSGLDSDHGEHSELLQSGQVDEWVVKGSTSLRTLAADMLEYAKRLSGDITPSSSPPLSRSSSPSDSSASNSADSGPSPKSSSSSVDTSSRNRTPPTSGSESPPSASSSPHRNTDVAKAADKVKDLCLDA
ncbi:hypothetical protein JCM11251_007775 [Rhodosporidiobolus azoricus]